MVQSVALYSTRLLSGTTYRIDGAVDGVRTTVIKDMGAAPVLADFEEALDRPDIALTVDVQMTNAEFKALRATPKTLIPAPGAGLLILVDKYHLIVDAAAGAYTESADNLALQYGTSGTDILTIETTGLIDGAAVAQADGRVAVAQALRIADANHAVELFNSGDGEFGGGNAANTVSIKVWYSIVPAVAFE